jgi:hypothetical protein
LFSTYPNFTGLPKLQGKKTPSILNQSLHYLIENNIPIRKFFNFSDTLDYVYGFDDYRDKLLFYELNTERMKVIRFKCSKIPRKIISVPL